MRAPSHNLDLRSRFWSCSSMCWFVGCISRFGTRLDSTDVVQKG